MRKQCRVDIGLGDCEEQVQLLWWECVGMNRHVGIERFGGFGVYEALKRYGIMLWIYLGESLKDKTAEPT